MSDRSSLFRFDPANEQVDADPSLQRLVTKLRCHCWPETRMRALLANVPPEIAEQAIAGDQALPPTYIAATAAIHNPDLRQDALVALLTLKPATALETSAIVQRVQWAHHRRQRREQRYFASPQAAKEAAEEAALEASADAGRATPILEAAVRLPAALRTVIVMRFVSDLNVAETAERLGVSEATVVRRTKKGLEKIKEKMSQTVTSKQ